MVATGVAAVSLVAATGDTADAQNVNVTCPLTVNDNPAGSYERTITVDASAPNAVLKARRA